MELSLEFPIQFIDASSCFRAQRIALMT